MKILNDGVKNFINFLQTMKKHEILKIDTKKVCCFDVNLNVIEKFRCEEIESKDLELFPSEIQDYIKNNTIEKTTSTNTCIDVLGVYIKPKENENANILLSKEKINEVSINYNISSDVLYNFVKTHEYAHAAMCTKLSSNNDVESSLYIFIEESLATAISLKKFKNHKEYFLLEKFVQNQPPQYSYGLVLVSKLEKEIEELMKLWKLVKLEKNETESMQGSEDLISDNDIKTVMFRYSNNHKLLPKEAKEIFQF